MDFDLIGTKKEIDEMITKKEYTEAYELCDETLAKLEIGTEDYLKLISQKINILIEQSKAKDEKIKYQKLEEALRLCNLEICKDNLIILFQKFTILIEMKRWEESLIVGNELLEKRDLNDRYYLPILSQKIKILIGQSKISNEKVKYQKLEEALKLCNLGICRNSSIILSQRKVVLKYLNCKKRNILSKKKLSKEDRIELQNQFVPKNQKLSILSSLLTRIYFDDINIEELE